MTKEKYEKINIIDKLNLSDEGMSIIKEDYIYNNINSNNFNKNKILIPNIISINQELPLIKLKKEKIIELKDITNIKENIY